MRTFSPPHLYPNKWERQNWDQAITAIFVIGVCTLWFCFTRYFYNREPEAYKTAIDEFSRKIETPVIYEKEESSAATDHKQHWLIGWLCIPYGVLICLLAIVPNPISGRLAFVFCGGLVVLIGATLVRQSKKTPPTLHQTP